MSTCGGRHEGDQSRRASFDTQMPSVPWWTHVLSDAQGLSAQNTLLARLATYTHKFAFLLAVNERADAIEPRHYDLAIHLVKNYRLRASDI